MNIGEYSDSLIYLDEALSLHPIDSDSHFTTLNDKGLALIYLNRTKKAKELYQNALGSINEKNAPELIHSLKHNYALSLKNLKQYKKALEIYLEILEFLRENYGSQHSFTAQVYNNIATTYRALNKYDEADEYHKKALKVRTNLFGKDHPQTALSYHNLAYLYDENGDKEKALEYYEIAFQINKLYYPNNHKSIFAYYQLTGGIWLTEEEFEKSIEPIKKAWDISIELFGKNSKQTYNRSEDFLEAALNLTETSFKKHNLEYWWKKTTERKGGPAYQLYKCCQELKDNKEALQWLEQSYLLRKERLGEEDKLTIQTYDELISIAKEIGHTDKIKK